jgi:wyosine [tRNA(Phe)-imidazoG37] synthetase (radical SAM superfamily)
MTYVFGPVPSRRLGQSLGIDPIPFKTCNWNCVYCQLGRSAPLRTERKEYVPVEDVLAEVESALATFEPGKLNWITFSGSGEPTLHSGLGRMIRGVKALTPLPVAVLTNGCLLHLPEVRDDLLAADAVLPSLDAGSEDIYAAVNRPCSGLSFEQHVEGLVAFRKVYTGRLWVEVMLVRGLNDGDEALRDIAAVLERIGPDEVHVNQPVRPPSEAWVAPPAPGILERARLLFAGVSRPRGGVARVVAAGPPPLELASHANVTEAVLDILARHPMDLEELVHALQRWSPGEVGQALARLGASGRIRTVNRMGRRFWASADAKYGDDERHRRWREVGS